MLIGYRTVNEEEAFTTNLDNKPFSVRWTEDEDPNVFQLGYGYYLTNKPGSWPGRPGREKWVCVIEANLELMKAVRKIWVPEYWTEEVSYATYEEKVLWNTPEKDILNYIHAELPDVDATKVLRFSYISRFGSNLQMVIPIDVVDGDTLDFYATCYETEEELASYVNQEVPWGRWRDIAGHPGMPTYQ
ncbi:uncharacterized protein L3040_000988 [Drepanopeziza brunnea f. sp. 'multigermtubi']|uniref:Uncharacterized protein n=1 Tax=Marssonina brunnea f. sp. multigermtubi (strain MB_m1) TaxID=1072389 RepID=K1WT99_MARBU|nr:uncharacterized protein MBM_01567 [Drepanopeziza brunnea f. sp. 'multigermtubi' MB_m1]EKD20885.1 hypothetical protein MBM_01567 [Drepanopeziza brunnea f. sp. 'multigermtubi' MB_m1]KAJ5054722.1 hypothetical protein L3040_000988 [Drepanopeziza brunnea f. sp. 'multigermtubi']